MRSLLLRLRALFFRNRVEQELDEELDFHVEMQTRKNRRLGMDSEKAGRLARVQLGASTRNIKEYCRELGSFVWLEQIGQDLRQSCRGLARSPGFTFLGILALALGIGVKTPMSVMYPCASPGR
jgi:hypothetical protein